jgi:hypothetical protein
MAASYVTFTSQWDQMLGSQVQGYLARLPVGVHLGQAKADLSFCCHMVHGHTYTQDATDMCIPNACPRLVAVDVSGLPGSHTSLIEKVPHFQVIIKFFAYC